MCGHPLCDYSNEPGDVTKQFGIWLCVVAVVVVFRRTSAAVAAAAGKINLNTFNLPVAKAATAVTTTTTTVAASDLKPRNIESKPNCLLKQRHTTAAVTCRAVT